jgi:hypothetical protein
MKLVMQIHSVTWAITLLLVLLFWGCVGVGIAKLLTYFLP